MRKILFTIFIMLLAKTASAGPQVFIGYQIMSTAKVGTIGFQYSWLKPSDGNWQLLSPGFATGNDDELRWSLQLVGRRIFKMDRNKWTNPADLYANIHLTGDKFIFNKLWSDKGIGLSLSFGW